MDLLDDASRRAQKYLQEIQTRRVAPSADAVSRLRELKHTLSENGVPPDEVMRILDEIGSPATMGIASPRFFGFVIGGALPVTVAANWIAGAWDQNAGLWVASPVTAMLEDIARDWLVDILGLPPGTEAGFVTGATMANFTCLAAGRHAVLTRAGWDVESRGLFGAPEVTVVIGEEAHPTLIKALGLLGLGRDRVVRVPVDSQGRIRANAFPRFSAPAIVSLQAGNVNSGAVDPLEELIPHAREAGAWVHVDGAFGIWANASPRLRHLTGGIAGADSWAMDAHKWLNVPYDNGIAFVRDGRQLREAMTLSASYLPATEQHRDPSNFTPELSRRARGIEVWAALLSLGRSGVVELIERCCRHAQRFAAGLRSAGYEILNEVVLNQVVVSFGDPEKTRQVIQALQEDGTCWCGATVWQGKTGMRISISSWATTDADVDRSLEAMIRIAKSVG